MFFFTWYIFWCSALYVVFSRIIWTSQESPVFWIYCVWFKLLNIISLIREEISKSLKICKPTASNSKTLSPVIFYNILTCKFVN